MNAVSIVVAEELCTRRLLLAEVIENLEVSWHQLQFFTFLISLPSALLFSTV
jgi:hypothetical protein